MGKSVPRNIKARVEVLMQEFPEETSVDFEKNKLLIKGLGLKKILGTKVTNLMAGYMVRKVKVKGLPPRPRKVQKKEGRDGDRRGGRGGSSRGGSRGGPRRRD